MSYYTYYQAVPEGSRLLARLRGERPFCVLYTGLIPYGPGPFHLKWLDPDELDDILNDFPGAGTFGTRDDVDRCLDDLVAELAEAVRLAPGLGDRAAYIEKHHAEIEGPLALALSRLGPGGDAFLLAELLYGGDPLAPAFFAPADRRQLRFVPAADVAAGVGMLDAVESLEGEGVDDYACEQYRDWKSFLASTAARGEAVLVFPTG